MVNYIGLAPELEAASALEGVHTHLYGKTPKPQRKIGHATVTAPDRSSLQPRLERLLAILPDGG